ncbi:MAG: hypothetical protein KAJ44_01115 [Thermoplasmatales archaeon]|nr:hypothetical protein [Thermoplasmatales archaeon]
MNNSIKKGVVVAIILLFVSVSVIPSTGNRVSFDDITPPVTTISFDPPEPNGDNGWYVSDVEVTLNASDNMSGVNATYYRINYGEWDTYEVPFVINESNYYVIEYYSVDNEGNVEDVKSASFKVDSVPPVTTAHVSGNDIWLTATDDMSGVNWIEFRIDGGSVQIGNSFTFASEGAHQVDFHSIDIAGNVEPWKSITVTIDYTPPTIEITWEVFGNFICGWQVIFTATCSDATSGMDYVEFYINEGLMFTAVAAPYEYTLEWSSALKSSTLKVVAHDIAGNSANATLNLSEIQSLNSMWLPRLLERFPLLNNLIKLFMERWRI